MNKLEIGKVCNVHGLRGAVKVIPWTDYPEVFEEIETVLVNDKEYRISSVQYQKANVILKLKGIDSVSDAENLRDCILKCDKNQFEELPEDTYYVADLIDCDVFENENLLGKLTYVMPNAGADVYEITTQEGKTVYLPAVKENVLSVDVKNKIIKVKLPEGLI